LPGGGENKKRRRRSLRRKEEEDEEGEEEEKSKKWQPVAARVELPFVCACGHTYVSVCIDEDRVQETLGSSKEDESARVEHTKGGTDIV